MKSLSSKSSARHNGNSLKFHLVLQEFCKHTSPSILDIWLYQIDYFCYDYTASEYGNSLKFHSVLQEICKHTSPSTLDVWLYQIDYFCYIYIYQNNIALTSCVTTRIAALTIAYKRERFRRVRNKKMTKLERQKTIIYY